ncbi:MAG: VWA domain-containing protein [Alphaproteobacteria bacterium]|nr:VWA domain-containing protein [Alphaproteobacteria bacterium]
MVSSLHRLMPALLLSVSALAACSPLSTAENKRGDDRVGTPIEPAPAPAPTTLPAQTVDKAEASAGRAVKMRAAPSVADTNAYGGYAYVPPPTNTERYEDATPNPVKIVAEDPVSTFSADVDTASYANVRRFLTDGTLPPKDAVRIEEMVNYFDYAYAVPDTKEKPFAPTVAVYPTPWNTGTQILHVGIQGYGLPQGERPPSNLVFLIDVSGSMGEPNKLPLVQKALSMLAKEMTAQDRISIVAYAGNAGVVLEPTSGSDTAKIIQAINNLQSGGSTAGGEGIRRAYELAEANMIKGGVNRVILATDGDFNVGITDPEALEDFVSRERDTGVTLTVLGFGQGNYNDVMMQKLAQAGNGNASYIDTLNEARKVLVDEMAGTLFTIAGDVKFQVEFNPSCVAEYRLIGYETRMLETADFNNDKVDAGDIGAGHRVTALYEITPVGSNARLTGPLRYAPSPAPAAANCNEIAYLKMRYKLPGETASKLIERPVTQSDVRMTVDVIPGDMKFAAAVAGFGQILRGDPYLKSFGYKDVLALGQAGKGADSFGYRAEFLNMVRLAQSASGLPPLTMNTGTE